MSFPLADIMKDITEKGLYNKDENQIRLDHCRVQQQFPVSTVYVSKVLRNQRIFSDQLTNNFVLKILQKYESSSVQITFSLWVNEGD